MNSSGFSKGMKNASSNMARFNKNLQKSMKVAGIAVAAVAGAVSLAVKGVLNDVDAMAKSSRKIGIPVDELSRLRHAADLSGISMGGLENGLKRLSANMYDAGQGIGEGAKAFKALGINVKNSDGSLKSSTQVMTELSNVFAVMPDGAEKTALAMRLMGKSGADMIPMLNGGADALKSMIAEADNLGIVITPEMAANAELFNDNLTRLGAAVKGLVVQLTAALAPTLAKISQYAVDLANSFKNLSPAFKEMVVIAASLTAGLIALSIPLAAVALTFGALSLPVMAVVAAIALVVSGYYAMTNAMTGSNLAVRKNQESINLLNGELKTLNFANSDAVNSTRTKIASDIDATKAALSRASAEYKLAEATAARLGKDAFVGKMNVGGGGFVGGDNPLTSGANAAAIATLNRSGSEIKNYQAQIAELQNMSNELETGLTNFEPYVATTTELNTELKKIQTSASAAGGSIKAAAADSVDPWKNMRVAINDNNQSLSQARDLAGGFMSDLKSGLQSGEGFWKSFGNAALSALNKIADKLMNDVLDSLFQVNKASSGLGGGGGGGILGGLLKGVGSLFGFPSFDGGGSTGSGARTGGMDGKGGFPAMLHPNETVIDHTKSGKGAGNQNLNISVQVVSDTEMLNARIAQVSYTAATEVADMSNKGFQSRATLVNVRGV